MIKIILKKGRDESLRRFHPWVFSGAISNIPTGIEEGDVVAVEAFDGRFIGVGHYQIGSIAVRILDFNDTEIDKTINDLIQDYMEDRKLSDMWQRCKRGVRAD